MSKRDPGVPAKLSCSYSFDREVEGIWHVTHWCVRKNDGHTIHICSCREVDDENDPR